jgi:hypothetical protein
MEVGILPGDFTIGVDESGSIKSTLVLSTAYNVLPLWLRIANDQLLQAKRASESVAVSWGTNDATNRELLVAELEPSLQTFVACGIALDALYDQLRPSAKLTQTEIQAWKKNRTGRGKQIAEGIRRVYRLKAAETAQIKQSVTEIVKFRDMAVHPSFALKRTCTRPDIPVGVDWKFSAFKYSNAAECFRATMGLVLFLYERKSGISKVDLQMDRIVAALEELKVVHRKPVP